MSAEMGDGEPGHPKRVLLFTGGGGAATEALYRLLGRRDEVHFADADVGAIPYALPAERWHQIPFALDPSFVDGLSRLCRQLKVDLLIPGVDEELLPIASMREVIGCDVLLPPGDFIKIHLDKLASNSQLRAFGLPVPQTERLSERSRISFPCIVKPSQGRGSHGVAIVRSEQELEAHIVTCRRRPEDFILQELLCGQEYTVMMAADRSGGLRAVVPVKVGIKKGITLRAETCRDDGVIAACEAIHAANPVPGLYNIQLIKSTAGDVKPFEINPRISTTACLGLAAGVNFVDVYLEPTQGGNGPKNGRLPFRDGLGLKRSWHNDFLPRSS